MSQSVITPLDKAPHAMKSRTLILVALAAAAIYGAVAVHLDRGYVDPKPTGRKVRILSPPFERNGDFVIKYAVRIDPGTVVYEDRDPLDQLQIDDDYRAPGYFQILPNGITFSSTDGTDPNDMKHRYWLVVP